MTGMKANTFFFSRTTAVYLKLQQELKELVTYLRIFLLTAIFFKMLIVFEPNHNFHEFLDCMEHLEALFNKSQVTV